MVTNNLTSSKIFQIGNLSNESGFDNPVRNRVYDKKGISPTLNTCGGGGGEPRIVMEQEYRIRKLTPKECWRLMAFTDEDFNKAQSVGISNTQLYKQAGNSITVCTLYYIFRNLYIAMPYLFDGLKVNSCFSGIGAFEKALTLLYEDINNDSLDEPRFMDIAYK